MSENAEIRTPFLTRLKSLRFWFPWLLICLIAGFLVYERKYGNDENPPIPIYLSGGVRSPAGTGMDGVDSIRTPADALSHPSRG